MEMLEAGVAVAAVLAAFEFAKWTMNRKRNGSPNTGCSPPTGGGTMAEVSCKQGERIAIVETRYETLHAGQTAIAEQVSCIDKKVGKIASNLEVLQERLIGKT